VVPALIRVCPIDLIQRSAMTGMKVRLAIFTVPSQCKKLYVLYHFILQLKYFLKIIVPVVFLSAEIS